MTDSWKGVMEPYGPTGRVLAVLEMLQARRRVTGAEIAALARWTGDEA